MKDFLNDVIEGLSATPKAIPSRYFYDDEGSRLFQQIMQMEEYYLPEAELDILNNQTVEILQALQLQKPELDIIELGAGDGTKTSVFLKQIAAEGIQINYYPLDISDDILKVNTKLMEKKVPDVRVFPYAGNFFKTLAMVPHNGRKRLIMFMGSNIGNMNDARIALFLDWICKHTKPSDSTMIAFDLKKDPNIILKAYNDLGGITKAFNLNLLKRINRELNGTFNINQFQHFPVYDPSTGTALSYLISLSKQSVSIGSGADAKTFHFEAFEAIHTEISRKFSECDIDQLCKTSNYKVLRHYFDEKKYYSLTLMSHE